jgi:Flp pilus assembly protein TadG
MRGLLRRFRSGFLRRIVKSESGVAAIEFAMVGGPFFLLVGGIIEIGVMNFTEYSIQAAVQQAARTLRTGQAQNLAQSDVQFKSKVCELAGIVVNCNNLTVYVRAATNGPAYTFANLRANLPSFVDVGPKADGTPSPASFKCGGPSVPVGVIATYEWKIVFPFLSSLANVHGGTPVAGTTRRLYGMTILRNEPYMATNTCS